MKKGDIVICKISGDYGKTRPAVIIQSDLFNRTHMSLVVCPITSFLIDAPLFRLTLNPTKKNGLLEPSQIMVDKMMAIRREKICNRIGVISLQEQSHLDHAVKLWLGVKD